MAKKAALGRNSAHTHRWRGSPYLGDMGRWVEANHWVFEPIKVIFTDIASHFSAYE